MVLEGVHALKHALRFEAAVSLAVSPDPAAAVSLLDALAPDVAPAARQRIQPVDDDTWRTLAPRGVPSPCLALAARPRVDVDEVLARPGPDPVVFLEAPTHAGNIGAAVRVAAAAGAAGVITTGRTDPWSAAAVRGAAGLQLAVATVHSDHLPATERPLVAIDPDGEALVDGLVPDRAVLAFGTERHGLSGNLAARADLRVRIPMRAGVSSLNLATAVAVVLYARRSAAPPE